MKCPHCRKDIATRLVLSEAAKINRKKSSGRKLTKEEASDMAKKRWGNNGPDTDRK